MIRELLAVGAGGAAGSIARYLLSYVLLAGHSLWGMPSGTLAVNAAGSLFIGVVIGSTDSDTLRWLLAVGFCGGFTTFSSFSADTLRLLREGSFGPAGFYIVLSVAVCIACTALGLWIGQLLKN